jgi:hypothetical protein
MKNVADYQLKKCIFLTAEGFENVVKEIYPDNEVEVEYSMDGLTVDVDGDCPDDEDLHKKLADYYDVAKVTSVHMDDCDYIGVWIAYTETAD